MSEISSSNEYDEGASGGYQLQYHYGSGSTPNNTLNRLHTLRRDGTTLADYSYLGQERVVIVDYSSEPEIALTYFASGQSGEADDPYVGLDRFGRIIDLRWPIPLFCHEISSPSSLSDLGGSQSPTGC